MSGAFREEPEVLPAAMADEQVGKRHISPRAAQSLAQSGHTRDL